MKFNDNIEEIDPKFKSKPKTKLGFSTTIKSDSYDGEVTVRKNPKISRSSSIHNLKKGLTPLQLVRKQEERKKRHNTESLAIRSNSTANFKKFQEDMQNENNKIQDEENKEEKKEKEDKNDKKLNKKQKKISKLSLSKCKTAISCNASLVSVQAEKTMKTREEEIRISRQSAGVLMQYSEIIKQDDINSLLGQSLLYSAQILDLTSDLNASLCRNIERRIINPMKDLNTITNNDKIRLKSIDLLESLNSIVGFIGVYSNYFKVGHKNLSVHYSKIMEYRSVVSFNSTEKIKLIIGQKCSIPLQDISMRGFLYKKGAIRHNWKNRWFILYYNKLLYYNSNTETVLKGIILLENVKLSISSSRKFQYCLSIATHSRTYLIAFANEDDLRVWQILIESAVTYTPLSATKRNQISLVEPKRIIIGNKSSKPTITLSELIQQDMYSRYWRDFRAKEPNMISWITEEENLCDLVSYALAYVPEVSKEEVDKLEESISKRNNDTPKPVPKRIKRTLSSIGKGKDTRNTTPTVEELKRSKNALLYKNATSSFTLLVASEQMAAAFIQQTKVMERLFNFMKDEKPPINNRQFHAFTELIIHLLHHRSTEVFKFLSINNDILHQLLSHIENEHCLRLLLSLWSYTQCEEKVNVLNQLGILALNRYFTKDDDLSEQEIDNLTIFIRELIRRHTLLTMRPETALILNKMKDYDSLIEINLEEGIEIFSPLLKSPPRENKKKTDKKDIKKDESINNENNTNKEDEKDIKNEDKDNKKDESINNENIDKSIDNNKDNDSKKDNKKEESKDNAKKDDIIDENIDNIEDNNDKSIDNKKDNEDKKPNDKSTNNEKDIIEEKDENIEDNKDNEDKKHSKNDKSTNNEKDIIEEKEEKKDNNDKSKKIDIIMGKKEKKNIKKIESSEYIIDSNETDIKNKDKYNNDDNKELKKKHSKNDKKDSKDKSNEDKNEISEISLTPRDSDLTKADVVFNHVRKRRESEVRRDWIDIYSQNFSDIEDSDSPNIPRKGSNAPQKPLPDIPQKTQNTPINRDHLNIKAPGFIESKTAPFMTALKNRNHINSLLTFALQNDNYQRSEKSVELLISILKINRSKESDEDEETDIKQAEKDIIQKSPHVLIMEIVKKFPLLSQLLRTPKVNRKTNIIPPLGLFRYNLVRLVRYVIDCGYKFVDKNLIDSRLIYRCIQLMFAYPKHSVLLSTMDEIITIIYTRKIHRDIGVKMIKKYHFEQKLMQVVRENNEKLVSDPIAAYMINFANYMSANKSAQKLLKKNQEWIEFLADIVFPMLVDQYVDDEVLPSRDSEKQKMEAEKWKKRWEEFNFLISV